MLQTLSLWTPSTIIQLQVQLWILPLPGDFSCHAPPHCLHQVRPRFIISLYSTQQTASQGPRKRAHLYSTSSTIWFKVPSSQSQAYEFKVPAALQIQSLLKTWLYVGHRMLSCIYAYWHTAHPSRFSLISHQSKYFAIYPSWSKVIYLKSKLVHVTGLLKKYQWFPFSGLKSMPTIHLYLLLLPLSLS